MIKSISDIYELARKNAPRKCVIAGATGENEINASLEAEKRNLIEPIFVTTIDLKKKFPSLHEKQIMRVKNSTEAAVGAVKLCSEGDGDILMKGSISTSTFLRPVLNSVYGLKRSALLSHIVVLEIPEAERLIAMTDGGMCINPSLEEKISILKNGVEFMHAMSIDNPMVGILSAIEKVNPKMPETLDAAVIKKAADRGQLGECTVDGPLAFDLMVSEKACRIKKINSSVCGNVNLILVPDITTGNSVAKALIHLASAKAAGAILGTEKPVVMLSRADSSKTKLNSIALGVALVETC